MFVHPLASVPQSGTEVVPLVEGDKNVYSGPNLPLVPGESCHPFRMYCRAKFF
jgi:hypothetical protein